MCHSRAVIQELEHRGHHVVLTARNAFQVARWQTGAGLSPITEVGRHYGGNPFLKVMGLLWRSARLLAVLPDTEPGLALSHGSRAQLLLCNLLRVPTVVITDYEFARITPLGSPKWHDTARRAVRRADLIGGSRASGTNRRIKEDVYAPRFKPDRRYWPSWVCRR